MKIENVSKIKVNDNEIIIDGIVYDLTRFAKVHPGGNMALNIFGGNDVTVHYYMLHNHSVIHKKALEPYILREAQKNELDNNYKEYEMNSLIYRDLKNRIKNWNF